MNEQTEQNNSIPPQIKTIQSLCKIIALRKDFTKRSGVKCNKHFRLVSAYFHFCTISQLLLRWRMEGDPRVEPKRRTAWVVAGAAGIVEIKEKKIEP